MHEFISKYPISIKHCRIHPSFLFPHVYTPSPTMWNQTSTELTISAYLINSPVCNQPLNLTTIPSHAWMPTSCHLGACKLYWATPHPTPILEDRANNQTKKDYSQASKSSGNCPARFQSCLELATPLFFSIFPFWNGNVYPRLVLLLCFGSR